MGTHHLPLGQTTIWKHPRQGAPERSRSGLECVQNLFGSARAASEDTSAALKRAYSPWKTRHTGKITKQCRKKVLPCPSLRAKIKKNNKLDNDFRRSGVLPCLFGRTALGRRRQGARERVQKRSGSIPAASGSATVASKQA